MHEHAGVLTRGWARLQRLSRRAQIRLEGHAIRSAHHGQLPPIPPARLIHLVAGTEDVRWFLDSGAQAARTIVETLTRNGLALEDAGPILDFGSGCGRVMRHWSGLKGPTLLGTDYNPDLVRWCQENLPFARFHANGLAPPITVEDASIGFVYALSVFTHLAEHLQRPWIDELARIIRPGGYLFVTLHGEHYLRQLSLDEQGQFRAGRLVVHRADREGSNDCAAFHPERYVRSKLARGFEVVDFVPEGALGNPRQDVYLLRKP
jgi:SAM-dependent methyltransferase